MDGCGCEARKAWLNQQHSGLGDKTERAIEVGIAAMVALGLLWAMRDG
jgi:hypothetical protein